MTNYRYSLEKYKGPNQKVKCPNCGANKRFVRYVDITTGEILNENVGRCERKESCGYHYRPREYFQQAGKKPVFKKVEPPPVLPTYFYDFTLVDKSLLNHTKTELFRYLVQYFKEEQVKNTFQKYFVGHSTKFRNSIVFWQIDEKENVRSGKYMVYNSITGKRDKSKFFWSKVPENYQREQCFFGLHLLNKYCPSEYKIGIVESEKTALICDLFFNEKIIWLASGGMQNLNLKKFLPLENRTIILFPDLSSCNSKKSSFTYWKEFGNKVKQKYKIDLKINNYLEQISSEKQKNLQLDLADFILDKMKIDKANEIGGC